MAVVVYDTTSKWVGFSVMKSDLGYFWIWRVARSCLLYQYNQVDPRCKGRKGKWCDHCVGRKQDWSGRKKVKLGTLTRKAPRWLFFLREVTIEEGEAKAKENNVMFIETSAKAGHNVTWICLVYDFDCRLTFFYTYRWKRYSGESHKLYQEPTRIRWIIPAKNRVSCL